jgi:uncharacterized lipoprotein YehR (DUF1307 family)
MKKFFKLFGIIALVAVIGLSIAACGDDDDGGDEGSTITITGITLTGAANTRVGINIFKSYGQLSPSASGNASLSGDSVTFSIKNYNGNFDGIPYYEKGDYFIRLSFYTVGNAENSTLYNYTDGKTYSELGVGKNSTNAELNEKVPKYTISSSKSTISFNKFMKAID